MNKYSWTGANNIFCWGHTRVNSLVMLASHECVLQKLLKDPKQTIFFVAGFSKNKEQIGYQVKQIFAEAQICYLQFMNIEELKKHLLTNPIQNQIIIICSPDLTSETQLLLRKSQFLGAIQFRHPSSQQPEGSLEFLDNYFFESLKQDGEELQAEQDANTQQMSNQLSEQQSKQVFIRASKKQELLNCITKLRKKRSNYKDLPNFVCLREEIQKSNILTDSIVLMSNQTVDRETRGKILQQLLLLSKDIASVLPKFKQKKKQFQLFIHNFKSGNIEPLQVIRIYTSEEYPIYELINNFLRALDCPTQIFYIQPIFKDLFTAISALYRQHNKRKFVCYRGGIMFEKQKHSVGGNVGEIVQNLGFISTSLSESIANLFMKNVMYQIHVDTASQNQTDVHYEFGYADISQHSFFYSELQVLFNPLNYFKVREMKCITMAQNLEEAHEFDEVIWINLSLGQVTRVMNKQERQLEEDEKIIKMMIQLQKERQANYRCQGDILSQNPQKWELRHKYWKQYQKLAELKEGKIIGLKELGNLELDHQNLREAQNYYEQMKQLVIRNQLEPDFDNMKKIKYLSLYHYLSAEVYSKHGKFAIALQLLNKAQQKILQIGKQSSPLHLYCLLSIGVNLEQLHKFEQALQVHLKCASYCFERQGQYHPDYLTILDALVRTYFYNKNFHYALILCKKCVVLSDKLLGSHSVLYMRSLRNLGNILKQHMEYEKSLSIFRRCASLIKEVIGEEHQSYWFELRNIDLCYQCMGKLQDALCIYEDVADKFLNKYGYEHPDYILCLSNKANILYLQCDYIESVELYRKITYIRKRVLGEFHPLYLKSLNILSKVLHKIGEYKQSLEIEQECLELWRQVDGKGSARQVLCLYDIAHRLTNLKRQQEAIQGYKQMLIVWLIKKPVKCLIHITACFRFLLQSQHIGNLAHSWLFATDGRFQKALMSYLHMQPIFTCFQLLSSIYYRMKEYKRSMKVLTSISSEQVHLSNQLRARIATEKQLITIRIRQQTKKAKMLYSFVCHRL